MGFFDKVKATAEAGRLQAAGADLLASGDTIRAEEAYRAAADALRPFGLDHPPVRGALWNHAVALMHLGRYDEANRELQLALTVRGGPRNELLDILATWDHPDVPPAAKFGTVLIALDALRDIGRSAGRMGIVQDPNPVFPAFIAYLNAQGHPAEGRGLETFLAAIRGEPVTEGAFAS